MKRIVLIGGGGHCKSVIDSLNGLGLYDEILITDSTIEPGTVIMGARVVGNDECLDDLFDQGVKEAFITVGSIESTAVRRIIYHKAKKIGYRFPSIVDKSAVVSNTAVVEEGVFIGKRVVVNSDAKIESFSILNTGAIIEHESSIGMFSHVSLGSVLCGNVNVMNDCFIGANSTVIQGVSIGEMSVIGAGSLILHNVEKNSIIKGKF